MKYQGVLLIERMILESLVKQTKRLAELSDDTGIHENILKILLQEMINKGWILVDKGIYCLRDPENTDWVNEINRSENLELEVKELVESMVSLHFKECKGEHRGLLRVQKLELTRDEEILLNSHLKNLEIFFKNIRDSRKKKPIIGQTRKQKIVIWGAGVYEDLVGGNLIAV